MRPPSALPPAESPSTRYSSHLSTSRLEQSRNLPGRPPPERAPLRSRINSFCLRAATRASAARSPLLPMALAAFGFSSRNLLRYSPKRLLTMPSTSPLPSFVLVWPSNCGCGTRQLITAVRPSRKSSPVGTRSLKRPLSLPYLLMQRVSAVRKPERCVPPSVVLMLLTYEWTFSVYSAEYCRATSTVTPLSSPLTCRTSAWIGSLARFRCWIYCTSPLSYWYDSFSPVRSSAIVMRTPWLRNASSCMRFCSVLKMNFVFGKICGSGLNVVFVPRLVVWPTRRTSVLGTPRSYSWW